MKCESFPMPGGMAIVCSRGRRPKQCSVPGCRNRGERECDAPVMRGRKKDQRGTCDRAICKSCATRIGKARDGDSVDYCPAHARAWKEKRTMNTRDLAPLVRDRIDLGTVGFWPADPGADEVIVVGIGAVRLRAYQLRGEGPGGDIQDVARELANAIDAELADLPRDDKTVIVIETRELPIKTTPADITEATPGPQSWSCSVAFGIGRRP